MRLFRAVGTLLVTAFAIVGVLLAALALFADTDEMGVTRVAGRPVLTVLSDSMTPEFKAGDILIESPAQDPSQLPVGTVITFHANNTLVTHRIVRVKELPGGEIAYRTQGDANNTIDATPVTPENVVGVYSWHVPYAGYVLNNVRTPLGLAAVALALMLFLLAPLFAKVWRATSDEPTQDEREGALESAGVN